MAFNQCLLFLQWYPALEMTQLWFIHPRLWWLASFTPLFASKTAVYGTRGGCQVRSSPGSREDTCELLLYLGVIWNQPRLGITRDAQHHECSHLKG